MHLAVREVPAALFDALARGLRSKGISSPSVSGPTTCGHWARMGGGVVYRQTSRVFASRSNAASQQARTAIYFKWLRQLLEWQQDVRDPLTIRMRSET